MSSHTVLSRCLGLNTKDHPTQLVTKYGQYLAKAVNVNITDTGAVERRSGYSNLVTGYTNAHSLYPFLDRYAIYADQNALYCYDTDTGIVSVLFDALTPDKPISYASVGNMLAFSNGVERGLIVFDGVVKCIDYFEFVADPTQLEREIIEFPITDIIHFFSGSMYGAIAGAEFLYCSEPYKPNHYDQVGGYITLPSAINWIQDVDTALLVGTDAGIYGYVGTGLSDFKEECVHPVGSKICSEHDHYSFSNLYYGIPEEKIGVFCLCYDDIIFIDSKLEVTVMTDKLNVDWSAVESGTFGKVDNNYIFSGVMT